MTSAINPIGSTTTSNSSASTATGATGAQSLGQDAFLKLLMAQLSNQDPLNPTDGTQFVTQLAQFSLVEQSKQQSTSLGSISTQLTGLANSDAVSLVGKTVTTSGSAMTWDGSTAPSAGVSLGAAASQVTVSITDAQGNVVRTMKLGAEPAGALKVTWDGHSDTGQTEPAGNYSIAVSATDAKGSPVTVTQTVTGVVTSVDFSQGYTRLTLSNGTVAPLSQLVSVSQPATTTTQP